MDGEVVLIRPDIRQAQHRASATGLDHADLARILPKECFSRFSGTLYLKGDFQLENNKARLKDGRGVQSEDIATRQLNKMLTEPCVPRADLEAPHTRC